MKPRVFVSSVIEGFETFRAAARSGVTAGEGEPVLIEDYPSIPTSPRNACLDAVDSCDAIALVIGSRGGWVAPSGKLVVEEELEEAVRKGLLIFVFIQETERDETAQALVRKVTDYTSGYFRTTFTTPEDLHPRVAEAVASLRPGGGSMNIERFAEWFSSPYVTQGEASLRLVLAPSRSEELIDPVTLGSEEFKTQILELAHSRDARLLKYEHPKAARVAVESLIIEQARERGRGPRDEVRLEVFSIGVIIIDSNVTDLVPSQEEFVTDSQFVIVEEDIRSRLAVSFGFCQAFYNARDPYLRHQQFLYNASLTEVGHRQIVTQRPRPRSSYSLGLRTVDTPMLAFDQPRLCNRGALRDHGKEADAILSMFARRMQNLRPF